MGAGQGGSAGGVEESDRLQFDRVLGLELASWRPQEQAVPEKSPTLLKARQEARNQKRWKDADGIRDRILAAGYEILDTPQGPKAKRKRGT